jgi:hypothetical protein
MWFGEVQRSKEKCIKLLLFSSVCLIFTFRAWNASIIQPRIVFPEDGRISPIEGYIVWRNSKKTSFVTRLKAIWHITIKAIKASWKGFLMIAVVSWTYDSDWRRGVISSTAGFVCRSIGLYGVFRPCFVIPWIFKWLSLFFGFASANWTSSQCIHFHNFRFRSSLLLESVPKSLVFKG